MKQMHLVLAMCCCFVACSPSAQKETTSSLILHNANIYTVNPDQPSASAVVAEAGKIVFVGDDPTALSYKKEHSQVIDLEGKTLTPGLIESHGHIMGLGYAKLNLDLTSIKNYEEMVALVAEAVKTTEPGEWILGRGWHQSKWDKDPDKIVLGYQVHDKLSEVSPQNPVYLTHASGYAGFANAKAMEIAGINASTTMEDDGEVIKDEKGQPTGIFTENAERLVTRYIPDNSPERNRKALELAIQECLAHGISSFQDAGSGKEDINLYHEFLEQDQLDINLWVMLNGRDTSLLGQWYAQGPEIHPEGRLTVRAIKLYADGALGSRGAWLLRAYTDRAGHFGNAVLPMEYIEKVAREGLMHNFQVCTHAIGDRANREVLDKYQAAFTAMPEKANDHRYRIEHAQHIDLEDIPRFAELGVIASMQGIHMSSDRPWAIYRLGKQRIVNGAYVWQKLLQSGAKVINGTDAPVEPVDPLASFYASVTRKTLAGTPEDGYEPDQKMNRAQALKSYTLDAAYGAFEEDIKGSIVPGKRADFTVFSRDIMTVPAEKILSTTVLMTIVGGEVKYLLNE